MITGSLIWAPLNHRREGSYSVFESALKDVVDFMHEHEPSIDTKGVEEILRNNFVSDTPTSVIIALYFRHSIETYFRSDELCGCPSEVFRVGHLWVSVDNWFGNTMLNIMQYKISLPDLHTVPIDDKRALLRDVIDWGKLFGAKELRTVAYGDALKRAYRMFYGIDNERNDYVIRRPL